MVKTTRSREGRPPGLGAWALGLVSLALCGVLSWFSLFAGLGLFQTGNLERAQDRLLSSHTAECRRSLSLLAHPPGLLSIARVNPSPTGRRNIAVSLAMLQVLESLEKRECDQAAEALGHFLVENRKLLAAHSKEIEFYDELSGTGDDLRQCAHVIIRQRASRSQLHDARLRKSNFEKQYVSLARDFAGLFALEPSRGEDSALALDPYQTGVLRGLPRVAGIKDGIPDLYGLKSELDRLGKKVSVGGANTHQAFMQRLEEVRGSTLWTCAAWRKASEDERSLQSAISLQEDELVKLTSTSRKKLSYAVYSLGKTEVDADFLKLRDWIDSRWLQFAEIIDISLDHFFLAIGL